jgi:hypothetical protein
MRKKFYKNQMDVFLYFCHIKLRLQLQKMHIEISHKHSLIDEWVILSDFLGILGVAFRASGIAEHVLYH